MVCEYVCQQVWWSMANSGQDWNHRDSRDA